MSEYFQGVTFANQNVSPVDDAILRRRLLSDGVLTGCDLTYAGYTLTMAAGYLIACGRQIRRPTAQNWAISDATSGYARVLMTIDLTRTATEEAFDQVNTAIEYATAEDGFPALIQDDINATGSQYQVALAVVSLGTGGITGIVSKLELAASSGGGDGGLNFAIVGGTTQPENPQENTIWVNTDTDITGWAFSSTEPESPVEGMVWIEIAKSSDVQFNALQKNVLQVYPQRAHQYVGASWIDKTAMIYQGGVFVEWRFWKGEIFDGTTFFVDHRTLKQNATITDHTEAGYIYIETVANVNSYGYVMFGPVDLSKITTLKADGSWNDGINGDHFLQLYLTKSPETPYSNESVVHKASYNTSGSSTAIGSVNLNVAAVDGEWYVGVGTYASSWVKARKLRIRNVEGQE